MGSELSSSWDGIWAWCINNFHACTLKSVDAVHSHCFEAGIGTWQLRLHPRGRNGDGSHLSVFLDLQDPMWAPHTQYKLSLVKQADASKSRSYGSAHTFNHKCPGSGAFKLIELSMLRPASAGWLVNDVLVLTVDVTVLREDMFQLDTGGVPCDVTLKLQCGAEVLAHGQILQLASSFFRTASGNVIMVDGSLGA
ncbi:hypothetical protein FOA52_010097 [Chlamydomonas sp. UWO 241]|nr:hypothetical protein FOA52_010097 [Chlamydomonas sp. UWO 241]